MAFLKEKDIKSGVEANMVRRFYRTRHRRIHGKDVNGDIVYQMFLRAFHSEYELIQEALGSGKIDSSLAEKLQQRISIDEMTYLQNTEIFSN
ncbi:Na+/H+ antiporter [Lentilactobacillus farraginis DSM 18382 = JCM 14108]|nr:Na+/H+ antiporter [Lentilactobacillus farraginis DSM 18382 = JCM 14108]